MRASCKILLPHQVVSCAHVPIEHSCQIFVDAQEGTRSFSQQYRVRNHFRKKNGQLASSKTYGIVFRFFASHYNAGGNLKRQCSQRLSHSHSDNHKSIDMADRVLYNVPNSSFSTKVMCMFEDSEAFFFRRTIQGRIFNSRHASRTHRVDLVAFLREPVGTVQFPFNTCARQSNWPIC